MDLTPIPYCYVRASPSIEAIFYRAIATGWVVAGSFFFLRKPARSLFKNLKNGGVRRNKKGFSFIALFWRGVLVKKKGRVMRSRKVYACV